MADGIEIRLDTTLLDRLIRDVPEEADRWLRGVGNQIVDEIVLSFGDSPPGREYRRKSVVHVASQPGYPPNVDTGALRASIRLVKIGRLHYQVQDGVEYGAYLEVGTESIGARPFVAPVFNEWREARLARDLQAFGVLP